MPPKADETFDVREVACPFHYFKTREKLFALPPGTVLEVWTTRLGAAELEKHLQAENQTVLGSDFQEDEGEGFWKVWIRREGGGP